MAKKCSWCGEQIGFMDLAYDWVEIEKKGYWICGKCCGEIASAKKGHARFAEIATDRTDADLLNYFTGQEVISEEVLQRAKRAKEQQQIKEDAQQTNPLYDDIHQIAGDLRFIKNYLVFCIVASVFLALVYLINLS